MPEFVSLRVIVFATQLYKQQTNKCSATLSGPNRTAEALGGEDFLRQGKALAVRAMSRSGVASVQRPMGYA